MRARQGYEAALVPGRQRRRRDRAPDHRPLRQEEGMEPSFRDTKDLRFGLGLSTVRIGDPQRRDRLLLLNAVAVVLLTLLGAAGERLGMDRHLKSNTVKPRTHSLFLQRWMLYDLI